MGEEVLGDDEELDGSVLGYSTVGAPIVRRPPVMRRAPVRRIAVPRKPQWRNQLAPGVPNPGQGLEPLPLQPNVNNGVFTAAIHNIQFTARPQAPFRAERLLTSVRRTGAAGVQIQATNLFIGRRLQLVELGNFDIEFFSPTAFGVRLNLVASEPGVLIRIDCIDTPAVAGADTVAVSMMFLGHTIR